MPEIVCVKRGIEKIRAYFQWPGSNNLLPARNATMINEPPRRKFTSAMPAILPCAAVRRAYFVTHRIRTKETRSFARLLEQAYLREELKGVSYFELWYPGCIVHWSKQASLTIKQLSVSFLCVSGK